MDFFWSLERTSIGSHRHHPRGPDRRQKGLQSGKPRDSRRFPTQELPSTNFGQECDRKIMQSSRSLPLCEPIAPCAQQAGRRKPQGHARPPLTLRRIEEPTTDAPARRIRSGLRLGSTGAAAKARKYTSPRTASAAAAAAERFRRRCRCRSWRWCHPSVAGSTSRLKPLS